MSTSSVPTNPVSPDHWLPLAKLNLRCNPFGERTREDRAELAVVDCERWLLWAQQRHHAVQFIGPCGRGKTTHLLAMRARLPKAVYVYLPQDGPLPEIPRGDPLMIDEAQRLPCRLRRAVLRRGDPLVLGTHVDLSRVLRRYQYRVDTTHVQQLIDARHLAAVFNRRIEASRLHPHAPLPWIDIADTTLLLQRFGSDVRAMESYLYERIQQHTGGFDGEVRFIA